MKIINFSHPLKDEHLCQLRENFGLEINEVIAVPARFDNDQPFAAQAVALVESAGLTAEEWQTSPPLLVPPAFGVIATAVLAEIEGRCGTFPSVVRLRPVEEALTPTFEVAEVISLLQVRQTARRKRVGAQ